MKYFLIVFFVLSYFNVSYSQSRKEKKVIDTYLQVSNQKIGNKFMPLIKWNRDSIGYYIYGKMKGMTQKKWDRFLGKVEEASGLHFYKVESNKDAQILIYFGKIKDYFKYEGVKNGFNFSSDWDSWSSRDYDYSFGLKKASFCIDKDKIHNFNKLRYMLKNRFLEALGLFGELKNGCCILSKEYSPKTKNSNLKKIDKECISLHYSDVIRSGMKKNEVKYAISADNIVNSILANRK